VHTATRQSDIWALNVNSSKTVKATPSDLTHMFQCFKISLDMIVIIFGKGAWPLTRDPQIFFERYMHIPVPKTVKDTDFKFHAHVSRDIPDIIR